MLVRLSYCFVCLLLRIRSILNWSTDLDTTEAPGAVRIFQLTTTSQKQTTRCFLVCLSACAVQCSSEYNKHCEHRDGSLLALLRQGHGGSFVSSVQSSRVFTLFISRMSIYKTCLFCQVHGRAVARGGGGNFFIFSSCSTSSISTLDRCCVYSLWTCVYTLIYSPTWRTGRKKERAGLTPNRKLRKRKNGRCLLRTDAWNFSSGLNKYLFLASVFKSECASCLKDADLSSTAASTTQWPPTSCCQCCKILNSRLDDAKWA